MYCITDSTCFFWCGSCMKYLENSGLVVLVLTHTFPTNKSIVFVHAI